MTDTTKAERRLAHDQALAGTRIEGHAPTPEFLADCAAVIEGMMTREQARAAAWLVPWPTTSRRDPPRHFI